MDRAPRLMMEAAAVKATAGWFSDGDRSVGGSERVQVTPETRTPAIDCRRRNNALHRDITVTGGAPGL